MIVHNPEELALIIKNQRKQKHVSQANLGDSVGLKQATVSLFENTPKASKMETVFRLLSAANLELHVYEKGLNKKNNQWCEEW